MKIVDKASRGCGRTKRYYSVQGTGTRRGPAKRQWGVCRDSSNATKYKLSRLMGGNLGKGGRDTNDEGERSGKESEAKKKRRYQASATDEAAQSMRGSNAKKRASYSVRSGVKLALGHERSRHLIAVRRKTARQPPVATLAGPPFSPAQPQDRQGLQVARGETIHF